MVDHFSLASVSALPPVQAYWPAQYGWHSRPVPAFHPAVTAAPIPAEPSGASPQSPQSAEYHTADRLQRHACVALLAPLAYVAEPGCNLHAPAPACARSLFVLPQTGSDARLAARAHLSLCRRHARYENTGE